MLLKTNKILKFKRDDFEIFREKVLIAKKIRPRKSRPVSLTSMSEILEFISNKYGAFMIELKDDTECFVGRFVRATKGHIFIQEIDSKAKWIEIVKYKIDSIRIIEFNTDYINSLLLYNRKIN